MILFFTKQTEHFANSITSQKGEYFSKKFSDGELFISIKTEVKNKNVWIIGAIFPPADETLELFFLLDALTRAGAKVSLLLTYLGYARQDRALPGQALSAEVVCKFLKLFALKKILVIHAHSLLLHDFLLFENIILVDLIEQKACLAEAVAAPDKGAYNLVRFIHSFCHNELILLTKIRPEQEIVKILKYDGIVKSRKILIIDDIIATGSTIVQTSEILKELGATEIKVWATHGIFSGDAVQAIEKSVIKKVYVTNTLPQKVAHEKIEVIDIAPLIEKIITEND